MKGDRLFFWEAAPKLRVAGLGVLVGINPNRNRHGDILFDVQYLTKYLKASPSFEELKAHPVINRASFVKSGPLGTVFPVNEDQARRLYTLIVRDNPDLTSLWSDVVHELPPDIDTPDTDATEGRTRWLQHLIRERDRDIVERKKHFVLKSTCRLACEVCGFDFHRKYGDRGREFCEVHHRKQLGTTVGEIRTRLADLAIVCSNCHRMIHRRLPMLAVEELRRMTHEA